MITRRDFALIENEIIQSVEENLTNLRISNQNDYALFLADGEYRSQYDSSASKLNPNVVDYQGDRYKDSTRLTFLSEFMTLYYGFRGYQLTTDDDEYRLNIELMIYAHIWEAQPFLKRLYRLAHLIDNGQYVWNVVIPKMGKHNFIITNIKKVFEENENSLFNVIEKGFHSSLRNAFAHADYFFDYMNGNKRIILDNYKGESWELPEISFDDWSKRFVYSVLLSYHLLNLTNKHRTEIITKTGTDYFQIKQPSKTKGFNYVWITYDKINDRFNFI